jgi:hypothetical protein
MSGRPGGGVYIITEMRQEEEEGILDDASLFVISFAVLLAKKLGAS